MRHVRDGRELPPIIFDDNYDFNYQAVLLVKDERNVQPGDELMVECDYDTSERNVTTVVYCIPYVYTYGCTHAGWSVHS